MKIRGKLALTATLSVVLAALPGGYLAYRYASERLVQETTERLARDVRHRTMQYEDRLKHAEANLDRLEYILRAALADPPDTAEPAEFDRLFERNPDGVVRNRRGMYDGNREAGVFIPPDAVLDDAGKRYHLRAKKALDVFGARITQDFRNVWLLNRDRSEIIFDHVYPDFVFLMAPDQDYNDTPWMTLTSPQLNPYRGMRWTPMSFDAVTRDWMQSAVRPLDVDGEWRGTLGLDVLLSGLTRALLQGAETYKGVQHFLIDDQGNFIMAGPWQNLAENRTAEQGPLNNLTPPYDPDREPELDSLLRWQGGVSTANDRVLLVRMGGVDHLAITASLKTLGLKYYRLIPLAAVLAPIHDLFLKIAHAMLLTLLVSACAMTLAANGFLIKPLLRLAAVAKAYGAGETDRRVQLRGNDELTRLGEDFDRMAESLQQGQRELRQREERYRTVINSVREVIFQIDAQGRWLLLSDAWESLCGYTVEESIGRGFYEFVAIADVDVIRRRFEALVRGETETCRHEFRLRTRSGDRLWVEFLAQPVVTAHDAPVFSGTLDDVSTRYFRREVSNLLRRADEWVADGYRIQELLQLFCERLVWLFGYQLVMAVLDRGGNIDKAGQADTGVDLLKVLQDPRWQAREMELYSRVLATGRSEMMDLDLLQPEAGKGSQAGHKGVVLAVPVSIRENLNAVLAFFPTVDNALTPERRQRLENLGEQVGGVLRRAEDQQWLRLQRAALESTANGVLIADTNDQVIWVNPALETLTGYSSSELLGNTPRLFSSGMAPDDHLGEMWETLRRGGTWSGERINRRKDGSVYTAHETITALTNPAGRITHYVAVQADITVLKHAEARLQHMATHDALTGLPNRVLLHDRLHEAFARAARGGRSVAVLLLDLDRFKTINDTLGHLRADELLRAVAGRLGGSLREHDTVARLGGDEFTILLPDLDSTNHAAIVAGKVLSALNEPFDLAGQAITITTSIGVSVYPDDGTGVEEILQRADAAMYQAKASGRNNYQFYTREIHERSMQRVTLERELKAALERDEFLLHYQPIADTRSGIIVGTEALLRWRHPQRGLLAPGVFMDVAEESGLIIPIGDWVLRTACAQGAAWEADGLRDLEVSVNLSTRQLRAADLAERVAYACAHAGFSSRNLNLELTESLMMENMEQGIATMKALKELGLAISIDDFGVGYSSLAYLKRFPLDTLKIDRSFMESVPQNSEATAIASTILAMARALGLGVIAEGVENEAQLEFLSALGCPRYQGYLLGKPMPAADLAVLARRTRTRPPQTAVSPPSASDRSNVVPHRKPV